MYESVYILFRTCGKVWTIIVRGPFQWELFFTGLYTPPLYLYHTYCTNNNNNNTVYILSRRRVITAPADNVFSGQGGDFFFLFPPVRVTIGVRVLYNISRWTDDDVLRVQHNI